MSAAGLSIVNSVVVSVFVLPNDIIVFFPFECRYSFDTCPVLGLLPMTPMVISLSQNGLLDESLMSVRTLQYWKMPCSVLFVLFSNPCF